MLYRFRFFIVYFLLLWIQVLGDLYSPSRWINHFGVEKRLKLYKINNKLYIQLLNGLIYSSPDNDTIDSLGLSYNDTIIVSDTSNLLPAYKISSQPLPSLKYKDFSPDEVMRVTIAKIIQLASPLLYNYNYYLGDIINPSIVKWNGRILITYKKDYKSNIITSYLYDNFSKISEEKTWFDDDDPTFQREFIGEDSRMIVDPNPKLGHDILKLIYLYSLHNYQYSMCITRATLNISSGIKKAVFDKPYIFTTLENGYLPREWGSHQKNWIPFIYHNENNDHYVRDYTRETGRLLFIQQVNPLRVVELIEEGSEPRTGDPGFGFPAPNDDLDSKHAVFTKIISEAAVIDPLWNSQVYGDPRGGTPAVLLKGDYDNIYLMIFHTRTHIPNNLLESYFFGAITMCAYSKPFRLYSISHVPIANISMYDGPWVRHFDYVVFPIGLIVENEEVIISYGRQDTMGYITSINLFTLLDSMRAVSEKCPPNPARNETDLNRRRRHHVSGNDDAA